EHLWIDLDEFDHRLSSAADALDAGTPSQAIGELGAALDLWRGEPLGGATAPEWAVRHQDRLRGRFVDACIRCAELLAAAGRHSDAVARLHDAIAADQWAERAHMAAVEIQLAAGDRAGAVAALRRLDKVLAELGVGRDPVTDALARRLAEPAQPPAQP
ncbi:MAG: bacterial transcriptional activator domain-containing protein, partial [Ilumatobacter sp.]|nr:bacterial transcriptional activator domain-containing protein [Ilumatobacter sp.]